MSFVQVSSKRPLEAAGNELLSRFEGLSLDELQARPAPESWSRQQVAEHLLLAYTNTAAEIERRLAKGSPTGRKRTVKDIFGQFMLVRCAYFPPGRKAPDMVKPERSELSRLDGPTLAAEYRRRLTALQIAIQKAETAWGSKVVIATHPVLGPMNAPQWRRFHAVHTLHHCGQMDRIARAVQAQS
jgi:hypothetical protein